MIGWRYRKFASLKMVWAVKRNSLQVRFHSRFKIPLVKGCRFLKWKGFHIKAAMPTTAPSVTTTKQKVALLSADPCYFLGAGTPMDASMLQTSTSQGGTDLDSHAAGTSLQTSFIKLESISLITRDLLALAMNDTVAVDWGCEQSVMSLLRPHIQFHWALNEASSMNVQETERFKTLVRFSGYIIFIQTALKMPSPEIIFKSSMATLKKIEDKIAMATCLVRKLLPSSTNSDIYSKVMTQSEEPSGQLYMEQVDPSNQHSMIRYIAGLALDDMSSTFSHLEVSESSLHLDGNI